MGAAAVVALEEVRQARFHAEARQRLHERFDRWLDQVESGMKQKPPTLEQLAQAVFEMRQDLLGRVTQGLAEQAHQQILEQDSACCPQCGRMLAARSPVRRTVETLVGPVTRSCACNERIIAEPETPVVYPSSIIMEGGQAGTRPVFPRTLAPRPALPLHAPGLGVAPGSTYPGPADQDTFQRREALAGAHAQALL